MDPRHLVTLIAVTVIEFMLFALLANQLADKRAPRWLTATTCIFTGMLANAILSVPGGIVMSYALVGILFLLVVLFIRPGIALYL